MQQKNNKYYIFWECVCSLRYSACNAHAPYCHLWSAWLYNIFLHYLINGTIFGGKKVIVHKKCIVIFSNSFCLKHFASKEELSEIWSKVYIDLHVKWPLYLSDFSGHCIFSTDFGKYSNIKFHENSSSESGFHADGWTDRHDKTNGSFSQFSNAPKICLVRLQVNKVGVRSLPHFESQRSAAFSW